MSIIPQKKKKNQKERKKAGKERKEKEKVLDIIRHQGNANQKLQWDATSFPLG